MNPAIIVIANQIVEIAWKSVSETDWDRERAVAYAEKLVDGLPGFFSDSAHHIEISPPIYPCIAQFE